MAEKIDILVGKDKRFHCEDFGERKGCGLEYKLLDQPNGKTRPYSAVAIPCLRVVDFETWETEVVWVHVPHWFDCPEQEEYKIKFMKDKAKKQAEWSANNKRNKEKSGDEGGDENFRSRRRGARRVSAEY